MAKWGNNNCNGGLFTLNSAKNILKLVTVNKLSTIKLEKKMKNGKSESNIQQT